MPVAKASALQIEYMVNYLYLHPYIVDKSFEKLKNPQYSTGSWEVLTKKLNNMWSRIAINDVKSWKALWRQLQNKTLGKLNKAMETYDAATGGVDGFEANMTIQDLKILRLLHLSSVDKIFTSANERRGELSNTDELNGEQKKYLPMVNWTDCTWQHSIDTESVGSFAGFDTLQQSADNIDDMEITMTFSNSWPDLGTELQPLLEFEAPAPLDESCPQSQQNASMVAPSFEDFVSFDFTQCWSMSSSCVPAQVEIPALPEPSQTTSGKLPPYAVFQQLKAPALLEENRPSSQQNPVFPAPSVEELASPALWQPWHTWPSSSASAKIGIAALSEPGQTSSCKESSQTIPLPVEAPASLNKACPASQQNPSFLTQSFDDMASFNWTQWWSAYTPSCVSAEVGTAALSEPSQTSSCKESSQTIPLPVEAPASLNKACPASQQNPSFLTPSFDDMSSFNWTQWWSACSSSCVPAKIETPALAEPCEAPSCEKPSSTVAEKVKTPLSCKVSHSLNGQQSQVRPKRITRVTKSKRERSRRLRNVRKKISTFIEQTEKKIQEFLIQLADLRKGQYVVQRDDVSSSSSSDRT